MIIAIEPRTFPTPSRNPLSRSAGSILAHKPMNRDAITSATTEFILNRAMRTISPTTVSAVYRSSIVLWASPATEVIVNLSAGSLADHNSDFQEAS